MNKSLIDMLGLRDFVSSMRRKRSKQSRESGGKAPGSSVPMPEVKAILAKIRGAMEETKDSTRIGRSKLAELIFADVLKENKEGLGPEVQPLVAKSWAFHCGEMVGLLAALAVKDYAVEESIDEVLENAKNVSRQVRKHLKEAEAKGQVIRQDYQPALDTVDTSLSLQQQKQRMIYDLESQAMLEKDLAAQAALRAMAERMKKELELDAADVKGSAA